MCYLGLTLKWVNKTLLTIFLIISWPGTDYSGNGKLVYDIFLTNYSTVLYIEFAGQMTCSQDPLCRK